ncbi:MAG: hypothetical protein WAL64_05770 [Candidatus Dormiibacterota bacterium]
MYRTSRGVKHFKIVSARGSWDELELHFLPSSAALRPPCHIYRSTAADLAERGKFPPVSWAASGYLVVDRLLSVAPGRNVQRPRYVS